MTRGKNAVRLVLMLIWHFATTSPVMAEASSHATGTSSATSDAPDAVPADTTISLPMIGIDLGARYARVAVIRNETTKELEGIPNDDGALATPTYVTWDPLTCDPIVGERAKQQAILNPFTTVYDFKRLLGQSFDSDEVQTAITQLPYAIVERDGKPTIQVQVGPGATWREFSPEDIAAIVLAKMKRLAEQYLGHQVADAVVTVPAYFNDDQRQAMRNAGAIAGLTFQRLINEPTAAAIAHKIDRTAQGEQNVIVVDLGAGTLDVTLLSIDGGVFEVLALNRNILRVGGDSFDGRIMQHCITMWKINHEIDVSTSPGALQHLRLEAERVKRALSTEMTATVQVTWTSPQASDNAQVLTESISREMFETMTQDLLEPLLSTLEEVLVDGGLKKQEVDSIVFVGGSTRVPMVREMVSTFFGGKAPSMVADEEEAVVHGAAIQARILTGTDDSTRDIIVCFDNLMRLSLGVETAGGVMHPVVSRNTFYPVTRSAQFTSRHADQTTATIRIYEGQHLLTKANRFLGQLQLTGLTPLADGAHTIEVTFDVDDNNEHLLVIAREANTDVVATASIPLDQNSITSEALEAQLREAEEVIEVESKVQEWISKFLDGGDEVALAEGNLELENIHLRELAEVDDAIVAAVVTHEPVSSHDEL